MSNSPEAVTVEMCMLRSRQMFYCNSGCVVFTAGVDPSNTSNGASISPNRAKVDKHSHTVHFVSTKYTVRAAPPSIRVNKNVTTFQSGLPQIPFSGHYDNIIVTFTGVNNSLIGGNQFILVVVGASAGALFLLGFIVPVTLLCLWRCLHVHAKDKSPGK